MSVMAPLRVNRIPLSHCEPLSGQPSKGVREVADHHHREMLAAQCFANSMQTFGDAIRPTLTASRTPHAGGARPSLERGGVSSTHPHDVSYSALGSVGK